MPKIKYLGKHKLSLLLLGAIASSSIDRAEIAKSLNVSPATFYRWIKDPLNRMSFNDVIKLCKLLGISNEELLACSEVSYG